jgi:hypothetical protein
MVLPPPKNLTAADGAEFHAMIEETPEGQWRASAHVRLVNRSHVDEQTSGIEMFHTQDAAREWAGRAAAARGFSTYKLEVVPQPKRGA